MAYSTLISLEELFHQLDDENLIVVDCRFDMSEPDSGRKSYQLGHIKGAVYAHLEEDLCGGPATDNGRHPLPTPEEMANFFGGIGIQTNSQVVVYDDTNGSFAARLWWMLRFLGHKNAAVLDGGLNAWIRAGYPLVEGIETNSPVKFQGSPNYNSLVQMDEVSSLSILIDSRAPDRYRGEIEPIDPVAGHIPGAKNYFYQDNWDENGFFLPKNILKSQISMMLEEDWDEEVTYYCGSGVTACVNILAHEHAGLKSPRLYVGSWGEWCRSPENPMITTS